MCLLERWHCWAKIGIRCGCTSVALADVSLNDIDWISNISATTIVPPQSSFEWGTVDLPSLPPKARYHSLGSLG